MEEFLRADTGTGWTVKFGVRNSVIRFLPNQIGNVRTPLPPPARLVRMVKSELKQIKGYTRISKINQLCKRAGF